MGNELANFAANIARFDSHRNVYENHHIFVKGKDYFGAKVSLHPLLCYHNLIVNLQTDGPQFEKTYFQYHTDLPDNLVGKISRLSAFSVVLLQEADPVIAHVKSLLHRLKSYNSINFIKLDRIKNRKYYRRLLFFPYTSVMMRKQSNTAVFLDNEVLS